jgi:DNA polymerase-3 subunit gamma/tau
MAKRKQTPPGAEGQPRTEPAGYTVLARRYRPQQFRDIVGQEPVTQALINAVQSNRVAHAYLFTGARGIGKTSTARILAKALNCVKGPTATPCDDCEICRSIASGEDIDVLEIDGASNRGIDEVREIRQNVQYRPSRARFKIYIIDEVHMLTPQAFNAILKTLEEPPPHVKFIFATTEVQKIPVTILSRCQRFDFIGIGTSRIVERLRQVVAEEKMRADDEALELIARRAAGSMRDAQSLLDQLLAFGDDRLTAEHVHRLLGTATDDRVVDLAKTILERDPKQSLELLRQAIDQGLQFGELLDQLIDYWRDLMVLSCAGTEAKDLSVPSRFRETLTKQATSVSLETILAGLDILAATKARLRGSSFGRVLVEMALVRMGRLEDLIPLSHLAQLLEDRRLKIEDRETRNEDRRSKVEGHKAQALSNAPKSPESPGSPPKEHHSPSSNLEPRTSNLTVESLPEIWKTVMAQVGPMLASDLGKGTVAISGPKTLVLCFPQGYNLEREMCVEPGRMARLQEAVQKITGQAWNVRVEAPANLAAASSQKAAEPEHSQPSYYRQRTEAGQEPLVKRAMEQLGAQILRVDEGFGKTPAQTSDHRETGEGEEA